MNNNLAFIIPYFKLSFFRETLESLALQTNQRFNVYIGNDASPEDPRVLLKEFENRFKFIYKKFENNLGGTSLTKQWDRCIALMNDEAWFTILGDDDVVSENYVEAFYNNLDEINENKCNVIKFSQCWIDEKGSMINEFTSYNQFIDPTENLNFKLKLHHRSSLSEHVFRKVKYSLIGFVALPIAWGSDDIAVLEFADNNMIYFIDSAKVFVRISTENISGREDNILVKNIAMIQYEKHLIKNHFKKLEVNYLKHKINLHLGYRFIEKIPLGFSILRMYLHLREFKKIIKLPKLYFRLWRN